MKGYKVFTPDWTCKGFKYEIGKTYKHEGKISLCKEGFHFCKQLSSCFSYYDFDPENKVAEIEASGDIKCGKDKCVCSEITIVRELTWNEVLDLANSGHHNTGHSNSGHCNSGNYNSGNYNSGSRNSGDRNSGDYNSGYNNAGDRNSGNYNSGDRNSGNYNSGDRNSGNCNSGDRNSGNCNSGSSNSGSWNAGDKNSGFLNSESHVFVFDKPVALPDFEKIMVPYFFKFNLSVWIAFDDMTENEKASHPTAEDIGGYLKTYKYKEAWKKSFKKARKSEDWPEEKAKLLSIPNFDFDIFEKITGITKEMIEK